MSSLYVNTIYPISGDTVTLDGNFTVTGDFIVTGSQVFESGLSISGSFRGGVSALSVVSNTASLNCSTNNFFTLQLISGSNVHISASNIQPGQTINVLVSTTGSGTISLSSNIDIPTVTYVPTTTTSKDVLTFVSWDSSTLYFNFVKTFS
jgi:hypothetical protein